MGVVHHHRERLAELDRLHPAGDRERGFQPGDCGAELGAGGAGRRQRGERVARVESPRQMEPYLALAPRCPRHEVHASRLGHHVVRTEVRGDPGEIRVRDPPGHRDLREYRIAEFIAGIEDRNAVGSRRDVLEQPRLGSEIAGPTAVQFEVLGGDPREHRGSEGNAVGAMHLERVRRRLESDVRASCVADAVKLGLELRRLGRCLPRRVGDDRVSGPAIDGRDRGGVDSGRPPCMPEKGRSGGLAVGAGDPRDAERTAGMVVKGVGQIREGHSRAVDENQWDRRIKRHSGETLGDHRNRSPVNGVCHESAPVGAKTPDGDEQRAGRHEPRVGSDRADLERLFGRAERCFNPGTSEQSGKWARRTRRMHRRSLW